jgi:alkylated DNA repair dioxygenase AlkB
MDDWIEIRDQGKILYRPNLFSAEEADSIFAYLLDVIPWKQEVVQGVPLPRLNAWYSDPGLGYEYSGVTQQGGIWTDQLLRIKERAEQCAGSAFNSLLLNQYRDGNDSIGFHTDAEPQLGQNPAVATLSFGSEREIVLKHRKKTKERLTFRLAHGSCFVMAGASQHHWLHGLPKSEQPVSERISLTFRQIISQEHK